MDETEAAAPLVGAMELGFASLLKQLQGGDLDVTAVAAKYRGFRRVRGDGNCFFRGTMFRLSELAWTDAALRERLQRFYRDSLEFLVSAGYDRVALEFFHEGNVEFWTEQLPAMKSIAEVEQAFQSPDTEHVVWYARVLAAAYMKLNPDQFLPFLPEPYVDVAAYCSAEVEPVNKECEQLEIIALCEALRVRVLIEYVSAQSRGKGVVNEFGPSDASVVHLLYRPGHYDVLYT